MNERIEIRRQPVQLEQSGWNAVLAPLDDPVLLQGEQRADVAVIGCGFAGLSAARRLLQIEPGIKVAILDAGRAAGGASGRNSGFMIDLPHKVSSENYAGQEIATDSEQTEHNRAAIRFAAEAVKEYGLSKECHNPIGKINAAATERGERNNRAYAAHLKSMNEYYEMFDRKEMRNVTGEDYYSNGLFTPGTVMFQPALYIRGLAKGISATAALYENSPVQAMERQQEDWKLTTPKGSLSAAKIILAVNGHVESFGFFKRRLMHIYTYASLTRALTHDEVQRLGGAPNWGITPADPMGTTVRRISGTGGDRILIRRHFAYDPSLSSAFRRLNAAGKLHDESFARRFPKLKHVPMEHRWSGYVCLSWNGVPAFGEVARNVYSACCQNALGASKGTLSGIAAAELALGQDSKAGAFLNRYDPPKRLPPEPFAWLGITGYIRYKEWQAGAEI